MASRLSRWASVAAGGAALVAATFLGSSGGPIIPDAYWTGDEGSSDPLVVRQEALTRAIERTRSELADAKAEGRLAPILAAGPDPRALVLRGGDLTPDSRGTAILDSLWRTLPARDPRIRTVAVFRDQGYGLLGRSSDIARLRRDGVCLMPIRAPQDRDDLRVAEVAQSGWECAYSERFGPPGAGVRAWLDSLVWSGLPWAEGGRRRRWMEAPEGPARAAPAWFGTLNGSDYHYSWNWIWSSRGRSYQACVVGRADQCVTSFGLAGRWPGHTGARFGYSGDRQPTRALPYALLTDLGPERFGTIWRSDEPTATSYARLTGHPIDQWLMRWSQAVSGRIQRDLGLSALAWVGVLLWLSLLGAWGAVRFKVRTVT